MAVLYEHILVSLYSFIFRYKVRSEQDNFCIVCVAAGLFINTPEQEAGFLSERGHYFAHTLAFFCFCWVLVIIIIEAELLY